jgi:hypothetical protein
MEKGDKIFSSGVKLILNVLFAVLGLVSTTEKLLDRKVAAPV